MKAAHLFALIVFAPACSFAQADVNLKSMVAAERAFIEAAKTQNRRDAFLYYLADSVITQGPDGPIKGKAHIQRQPVTDDWLRWSVNWSEVAYSGDFGFNTGPWEYYAKRTDEKPAAFGEFNSVWKKQSDGSWKVVLDIGISHDAPSDADSWKSNGYPADSPRKPKKGVANELLLTENNFQRMIRADRTAAYRAATASASRLMFSGHLPYRGLDSRPASEQGTYLDRCPMATDYVVLGHETASSQDMGYVYGTVNVHTAVNGTPTVKKGTFVRVWVKENPGKWTLRLDVLSF